MTITNGQMRINRDNPAHPDYDPEPRKAWSRGSLVTDDWVFADEFRRVIVLRDGKALMGDCRIERLPKDDPQPAPAPVPPVAAVLAAPTTTDSYMQHTLDDLPLMQEQHLSGYAPPLDPERTPITGWDNTDHDASPDPQGV